MDRARMQSEECARITFAAQGAGYFQGFLAPQVLSLLGKGTFTTAFEVIDPQCDWNHATWDLETDGARTEVRRSARAPQLRIPVQALAAMVNGFLAPSALLAMGRIEAADHADLDLWDAVFRARSRPFCADDF